MSPSLLAEVDFFFLPALRAGEPLIPPFLTLVLMILFFPRVHLSSQEGLRLHLRVALFVRGDGLLFQRVALTGVLFVVFSPDPHIFFSFVQPSTYLLRFCFRLCTGDAFF